MGVFGYAIAAGIGYYAGQPEGRRQLANLRRMATERARSPEAKQLRERGWDLVGDGALATRNFVAAKARSKEDPAGGAPEGGTAVTTRRGPRHVLRGRSPWRRSGSDAAAAPEPTAGSEQDRPAGFTGTTVAEDSKAAILGIPTPPLAARTQPAPMPEDRP